MAAFAERVVVLTGGTSGIGEATALKLAEMGARLVLVARDPQRTARTLELLQRKSPSLKHTAYFANLSRPGEASRAAREIAAAEPQINILINNAGIMSARRQVTADGFELTFATNHLAYFALTQGLLARLLASAPARIVNTASEVHRGAQLDFDDLQSEKGYTGYGAYAKSKLANVLFTSELARRLAGSGVTVNCLHPGVVASRFGQPRSGEGGDPSTASFLGSHGIPPEEAAAAVIHLATSPDLAQVTGRYFNQKRAVTPSVEAQNLSDAEKLWGEAEKSVGLKYEFGAD